MIMISIYTDASVSKGSAVATCIILSTDTYIGYNVFSYENVSSSLHGELLGILDGIRYAKELGIDAKEPVTIYSDNSTAVHLATKKSSELKEIPFRNLVTEIHDECADLFVTVRLIRGHQTEHNPNKVVDLTSNTVLRLDMNGGKAK